MKKLFFLLFFAGCSSVLYYPDRHLHHDPQSAGLNKQEHWFSSKDGTTLYSWAISTPKVESNQGVIVQFHGNAENLTSHYASLAWATRHGFLLFAFDYRGYGRSGGKPDPDGLIEDGVAAIEYAYHKIFLEMKKQNPKAKFIVIGQSIGGIIAPHSVNHFSQKGQVDMLILEATFSSYRQLAFNKFKANWLTWLFSPVAWAIMHEKTASKYVLPELSYLPVLVIHGTADRVIPLKFGQDVFKLLPGNRKYFWPVEGADHLGIYYQFPEFQTKLIELFKSLP